MEKLEQHPEDAEANLVVGKNLCFRKGDWDDGLDFLARGSDPVLKELAQNDLALPRDAKAQIELGDAWWERAMLFGFVALGVETLIWLGNRWTSQPFLTLWCLGYLGFATAVFFAGACQAGDVSGLRAMIGLSSCPDIFFGMRHHLQQALHQRSECFHPDAQRLQMPAGHTFRCCSV